MLKAQKYLLMNLKLPLHTKVRNEAALTITVQPTIFQGEPPFHSIFNQHFSSINTRAKSPISSINTKAVRPLFFNQHKDQTLYFFNQHKDHKTCGYFNFTTLVRISLLFRCCFNQRSYREGSKPLFSRDDLRASQRHESSPAPHKTGQNERSSSESSEESTRPKIQHTRREKSHSPKRRRTPEKTPYFLDAKREEDRLRAKYGRRHSSGSRRRSRARSRSPRRSRWRSRSNSRSRYRSRSRSHSHGRRHRSYARNRSSSRDRYRDRSSSRGRSRRRSPYPEQRVIPVVIPVEYPCPAGWIAPPMHPYPRNPFMLRPPVPYYPLRPPFPSMEFPIRPPRFPGRQMRPYRPGPTK